MLIRNIILICLLLITDKLFSIGSLDKQNYYAIPGAFIGNEFELCLGGKIHNAILKKFYFDSSINKYYYKSSESKLFNDIYLTLDRKNTILQIELELGEISITDCLQENNIMEQVFQLCNDLYGKAEIKQRKYIYKFYSGDHPLSIVMRNMVKYEWNTGDIKIEYFFLPKDKLIEINELLPKELTLWHKLTFIKARSVN